MKAKAIVNRLLEAQANVVMVFEQGTSDPFCALYINGNLTVENPRGDVSAILEALGIVPREVFVAKGFSGDFPPKLAQLRLLK